MDSDKFAVFWILIILLIFVVATFRGSWVDKSEATRAFETQGYTNVQITEHKWFFVGVRGCEGGDAARFDATVRNPAGKQVRLFVCVGWPFKGATIRTE